MENKEFLKAKISNMVFLKPALAFIAFLTLESGLFSKLDTDLSGIFLLLSLGLAFLAVQDKLSKLELNGDSINCATGLINRSNETIKIDKIEGVTHTKSLIGQIAKYGTVILTTASGDAINVHYVRSPEKFTDKVTPLI